MSSATDGPSVAFRAPSPSRLFLRRDPVPKFSSLFLCGRRCDFLHGYLAPMTPLYAFEIKREHPSGLFRDFLRHFGTFDAVSFQYRVRGAPKGSVSHDYQRRKMVGAGRFELPTPGPPDRCANRAALRSDVGKQAFPCKPGKQLDQISWHRARLGRSTSVISASSIANANCAHPSPSGSVAMSA